MSEGEITAIIVYFICWTLALTICLIGYYYEPNDKDKP